MIQNAKIFMRGKMLNSIFLIIAGFILLMGGAEYMVKGAVAIANRLHIPTIIIGLTIVAFGTSAPEFVVSIKSALNGSAGISVGNIVGSNIANILLVLGLTALISPITCDKETFIRDYKFLFISSALFIIFSLNNVFIFWHGIVFLLVLGYFVYHNYKNSSQEENSETSNDENTDSLPNKSWFFVSFITIAGLISIIYGADVLINGAVKMARLLGVSEEIIGLTIIAVGTSLPELATTALATIRHQTDVAIGNIVGSNIWNVIFIMGATATITEVPVPRQFLYYDMWVMALASILLYLAMIRKSRLTRIEGGTFLIFYIIYVITQILISKEIWII